MKHLIARFVLPWATFALAAVALPATGYEAGDVRVAPDRPFVADSSAASFAELQRKGRYKQQGDDCVWDNNDDGPNQCTPQTEGRFKRDGDNCVWDPKDRGPDQCSPKKGRFKQEKDRCVWDANDDGPNQCNPRQPRSR